MSAPIPPQSQPPAPTPPTGPDARRQEANRALLVQTGLLGATLLALALPLPWKLLAAVTGLAAVVVGIRSWLRLRPAPRPPRAAHPAPRRAGTSADARPGQDGAVAFTRVMIGLSVALAAAVTVFSLSPLLFWDASMTFQECLDGALTERSRAMCQDAFETQVRQFAPTPAP